MDMNIDTEALISGADSMSVVVNRIKTLTEYILVVLKNAGEDFDSINYYRIEQSLNDALKAINDFDNKIEIIKKFLQRLEDIIYRYNECRF